eukprot:CFRG1875T1
MYNTKVAEGTLNYDPRQVDALAQFDNLYRRIAKYTPPAWPEEEIVEIRCKVGDNVLKLTRGMRIISVQDADKGTDLETSTKGNVPGKGIRAGGRSIRMREARESENMLVKAVRLKPTSANAPKGLYLYGGVGCGKSMLMDQFFESISVKRKKRIHFHTFMRRVYADMHAWSTHEEGNLGALTSVAEWLMEDSWLICFDEVQVADTVTASLLSSIFDLLFQHGVVLVATSNRPPDVLHGIRDLGRDTVLNSLPQNILAHCEVHDMHSTIDYREKFYHMTPSIGAVTSAVHEGKTNTTVTKKTQNNPQTYFRSDREEHDAFTRLLSKCSTATAQQPAHTPSSSSVRVLGRDVLIPYASEGTAKFTFAEICAAPLGPHDYSTICKHFHTIFVEGVPSLTSVSRRNELRRFITLLDAMYETKTKLVILAEGECTQLLLVDHGVTSTDEDRLCAKRALSRLFEMQSATYLAIPHQPSAMDITVRNRRALKKATETNNYANPSCDTSQHSFAILDKDTADRKLAPHFSHLSTPQRDRFVSDDFADEASYGGFCIRQSALAKQRATAHINAHKANPPTFGEKHFFGYGWWENALQRYRTSRDKYAGRGYLK